MILILSSDLHELTTEDVMDWLYAWDCPFRRINGEFITDAPYAISINDSKCGNYFNSLIPDESEVKVIWYRRWHKRQALESMNLNIDANAVSNLKKHLNNEIGGISTFFFNRFKNATWVDHPKSVHLNKLNVLSMAVAEGLTIPDTIVTNSKKELKNFLNKHQRVITKPVTEVSVFNVADKSFGMDTKEVSAAFLDEYEADTFFPSLLQELIEKKFDLRIFFLDGKFYSMAILSQRREESVIDFRNYNFSNPDRRLPYKLPADIEDKLRRLILRLKLEHCSVDMIKSTSNEYVFLEVNPVGQFGMVSRPCNYHLEMHVAEFLKQKNDA